MVDFGLAKAMVQQFPDLQVVLLEIKLTYEMNEDDARKAIVLPFWQAEPLLAKARDSENLPFIQLMLPYYKMRLAQARMDQRFALLRCVEALRTHAAEHDGKLPARLDDIKLPLPIDPITGQALRYKLEARTAHLRGTPPPGMEKSLSLNYRYEITVQRRRTTIS